MQSLVLTCGRSELASLPSICVSPAGGSPAPASAHSEPARENAQLRVRTLWTSELPTLCDTLLDQRMNEAGHKRFVPINSRSDLATQCKHSNRCRGSYTCTPRPSLARLLLARIACCICKTHDRCESSAVNALFPTFLHVVQEAAEAAHEERAALLAALSAVRAEMEATAAAVAAQRAQAASASAASLRAARRQIRRLAAENEALMRLSNAQHAELARRLPPEPELALTSAEPDQALGDAAEVAARLGRIEAALVERAEGRGTGAGPGAETPKACPGRVLASQEASSAERQDGVADAEPHAGAAASSVPVGLHVAGCEARLAAAVPRRSAAPQAQALGFDLPCLSVWEADVRKRFFVCCEVC